MSKFRNRNIRNKFTIPDTVKSQPDLINKTIDSAIDVKPSLNEVLNQIYCYNGYAKTIWDQVSNLSSCGSSDIEIIDDHGFRKNSYDNKSSTSSLSWGEDYETNATELVKDEFERMERVLQCVETIPSNYDRDEYKLWIKTFPFLSLTGRSSNQSKKLINEEENQLDYEINNEDCDISTSKIKELNFKITNNSVIDYDESPRKHDSSMQHQHRFKNTYSNSNNKELINSTLNPSTLDLQFDSFLTISPAPISSRKTENHSRILEDEFTSLPYLSGRISQTNPVISRHKKISHSDDNTDFIILPPIEVSANNYQYRSISATNGITKKANSAFSLQSPVCENYETNSVSISENGFNRKPPRRRRRFVDL